MRKKQYAILNTYGFLPQSFGAEAVLSFHGNARESHFRHTVLLAVLFKVSV